MTRARVQTAVRVLLVLALVGVAARGLASRRGLDWESLSEPPDSAWTVVVLLGLASITVAVALRAVRQLLRRRPGRSDEDAIELEGRRLPWYAYAVAVAVVALALVLVALLVRSALDLPPSSGSQDRTVPAAPPDASGAGRVATDPHVLLVAAGVALALAAALAARRSRAGADEARRADPPGEPEEAALADAVAAAEEQLAVRADGTREAIMAAYTAMENQLVGAGARRRASDTPTDFLERASAAARISPDAAGRLTELFREARFSSHRMPPEARGEAARALARVADELAGVRG